MTINDFENNISQTILERGYSYFSNEHIISLNEDEPGMWYAVVSGNENYNVTIEIKKNKIQSWECDCPFEGDLCKHVAAVLYAIKEINLDDSERVKDGKSKKKRSDEVKVVLSRISKEELFEFLNLQFRKDMNLRSEFLVHFSDYIEASEDGEQYRNIVKNLIAAAGGRQEFIEYRSVHRLCSSLMKFVNKAEDLLDNENVSGAINLCKILIEEVAEAAQYADDSNGELSEVIDNISAVFSSATEEAAKQEKHDLFRYYMNEYPKPKYHNIGCSEFFLEEIQGLISNSEQEEQFLDMIDRLIEKNKKGDYSNYSERSLLERKIDYFTGKKQEDKARKIIEENRQYPEFMKILVDEKIKKKSYSEAISLCKEGIKTADEKHYSGDARMWYEKLLIIYGKTNDITEIRKINEKLFFEHFLEIVYYKKLKSTYKPDEWKEVCESLINRIKGKSQNGLYYQARGLANIFVEEKYEERLLKLLQINSSNIKFIDEYAGYLKGEHSDEIIKLYEEGVKKLAEHADTSIYKDIAGYLKKVNKINGGDERVKAIVSNFRNQYKNRKAMMKILAGF